MPLVLGQKKGQEGRTFARGEERSATNLGPRVKLEVVAQEVVDTHPRKILTKKGDRRDQIFLAVLAKFWQMSDLFSFTAPPFSLSRNFDLWPFHFPLFRIRRKPTVTHQRQEIEIRPKKKRGRGERTSPSDRARRKPTSSPRGMRPAQG